MSIIITPETKQSWERAIEKAKQIKPRVKIIGFGHFEVEASNKRDWYTVRFTRNVQGEFEVSCTCTAHTSGKPSACYHCPPCGSIFKHQVRERSQSRSTCTVPHCHSTDNYPGSTECRMHVEEIKTIEAELFG